MTSSFVLDSNSMIELIFEEIISFLLTQSGNMFQKPCPTFYSWWYEPLMCCKESQCLDKMNRWSPPWYNPGRLRRQACLQQLGHTALHYVNTQNGWPDMIWYSHWEDVYSHETNQCKAWLSVISTHSLILFYNVNVIGERMRFLSPFNIGRHILFWFEMFLSVVTLVVWPGCSSGEWNSIILNQDKTIVFH